MEASRAAVDADVARIVELAHLMRAELRPMKGGSLWVQREAWPEPLAAAYHRLVTHHEACVVVGTIDATVIGYGVATIEELRSGANLGVVTDLFVERDARSVGVGESMALALVEFCRGRDCVGIDALALPGHRDAKNFFERNGFTARALTMHRALESDTSAPS